MGRHTKIDPDEPFEHKHLKGETRPSEIKKILDDAKASEERERDRVIKEVGYVNQQTHTSPQDKR